MPPVFYLRDYLCHFDAGVRTADCACGTGILAADRIRRCIVQWGGIYASDYCTKKYRPDGSIIVDESGICICCTGWMGYFRRKTFRQRICGMRTGIFSSDSCPAPGTESSPFRYDHLILYNSPIYVLHSEARFLYHIISEKDPHTLYED